MDAPERSSHRENSPVRKNIVKPPGSPPVVPGSVGRFAATPTGGDRAQVSRSALIIGLGITQALFARFVICCSEG